MVMTSTSSGRHRAALGRERGGYPEDVDRDQTAQPREHAVDRMSARTDQKVDMFGAVVDGMEAPKKGDFVGPPMAPVETDLADHQPGEDALPQWPCPDCGLQARRDKSVGSKGNKR